MTFKQRRLNVDATSWRCIDVEATLYSRHVSAGFVLSNNPVTSRSQSGRFTNWEVAPVCTIPLCTIFTPSLPLLVCDWRHRYQSALCSEIILWNLNTYVECKMTIIYQYKVATTSLCGFFKLLGCWRGSVYKLMFKETLIFCGMYTAISLTYRLALSSDQRM